MTPKPGTPQQFAALDWLIRLFLLEETLPQAWIPAEILDLLRALGLVTGDDRVAAAVKLYPVQSVYVISDLDLSGRTGTEHVFSAISPRDFDLIVVLHRSIEVRAFLFDTWRQFVDQRRIRQFRYVNVIVERHREAGE